MIIDDILNFGKHKGFKISEIYKTNPGYVRWLSENCNDDWIKFVSKRFIGTYTDSKLEQIIKECIMSRGYSESEAMMFINTLKKSGQ